MNSRHKRSGIGIALLLMFSLTQIYVGASFAGSDPRPGGPGVASLVLTGTLITSGKQPIQVNGISAVTDATIVSGSSIESPKGVSATVNLGQLGSLEIAPATSLQLEFIAGRIRVTSLRGCVILHTKRNTTGTISTPNGIMVGITDPAKDDVLDICQNEGAAPLVNEGAAANAGAGAGSAGGTSAATAAGAASTGGLSETAGVLIGVIGGGAMIAGTFLVLPCDRAPNPSPATAERQCR